MQNPASFPVVEFPVFLARLPADLGLDRLAIEHKAIQRGRMSLRDAAGWAGVLGLATLSNPAVNDSQEVWADSAYRSQKQEDRPRSLQPKRQKPIFQ
ncbi:MAG: hypothetical protein HQL37_13695 [Alphaproteobacteria bacterium]|nr:hypothetical protein [Alphaproteobacteria bacterium]